ncbi:MAG: hypothetical protein ACI35R_01915 [Bacillus sp. (in: firmicutes)]
MNDMDEMTIGMCLDYIAVQIEFKDPKAKKTTVRQADQTDFDSF